MMILNILSPLFHCHLCSKTVISVDRMNFAAGEQTDKNFYFKNPVSGLDAEANFFLPPNPAR
jgi:hypothetical protein